MASSNTGHVETGTNVSTISTSDLSEVPAKGASPEAELLYPDGPPQPSGTTAAEHERINQGESTDPMTGNGVEGETIAWDAHYSSKNFVSRIIFRVVLTVAWLSLAYYAWDRGLDSLGRFAWIVGMFVGVLWTILVVRLFQAYYGFHYRLTNRRLFHSIGILNRRRDMMELLRVKDVFTRQQSLMERWVGVGTVVVVPTEKELPTFYLVGVENPKEVMDLIWHHTRVERDLRSIKVDQV